MCPRAVTKKKPQASKQQTQVAKLWLLLVGVNQYSDTELPSLQYSALDCQGLGEALTEATATFPAREIVIHHDFADRKPQLVTVRDSLEKVLTSAQPDDTILFYFSGHGILDEETQQVYLCLGDTQTERLTETGLPLQEILQRLGNCQASQQLVWLDACHSGGMTLRGADAVVPNPTKQLVKALRIKAQQSKGFYALLSCDQTQQSWEFPELGHGVFTYYLMRGLRGEAADSHGVIEADALYQYVYHQTLRYIDRSNQQIRLINQQKSSRGERKLQTEYPIQTPKRIVEGFGRVVIGQQGVIENNSLPRRALVVDGLGNNQATLELSKVLRGKGGFELEYFPPSGKEWQDVKKAIKSCLYTATSESETTTAFLYLRGKIRYGNKGGEAYLLFKDGAYISQEWLRKILHQSPVTQQIVILDCPETEDVKEWVEELKVDYDRGQCIIAASNIVSVGANGYSPNSKKDNTQQFTQALINTLQKSDPVNGLSVAAWISQLQIELAGSEITPQIWLSGTRGVIEVLPAKTKSNGNRDDSTLFDINVCPYMGLQAFTEDNAQYFYGREALVQKLLNHVSHNNTLAVVGASGSGKSSVVQAGLFNQLRQGKQIPNSDSWLLRCFRPGSNPFQALAHCLVEEGTAKEKAQQQLQIEGLLYEGVEGFAQWLRTRPEPMVVLAVDQFEELFTLASEADRYKFIALLLKTIEYCSDRFCLIFTVRADFVATCLEFPELAQILQQSSVLVPPYLTEADYRDVIIKPAKQVGLKVEPSLVEVLLQELNGATGDLPLLQFVLQKLWENRKEGTLTLKAYKKLGGIKGALEQQAQELYDSLDAETQDCARWIFLNLTKIGEGTEDTRRRVTKSDLIVAKYPTALVEKTLQKLTAAKLIVTNLDDGMPVGKSRGDKPQDDDELLKEAMQQEATVEVVHEILIRHWTTLRWWLEENRSRLQLQRQIEQAALLWQKKNKQPDFLLKGVRLAEAEDIYIKYNDELTNTAQDFLAACIEERLKEAKEVKKRLRRTQITAGVLGLLGIATTTFGGLAYRQKIITQMENIDSLNASAEALLFSNQQLESVITSLKAGKQLKSINGLGKKLIGKDNWQQTKIKTAATLQQTIYGTQEVNRLEGHGQKVNAVSYSSDGSLVATASDDGTIKIWTTEGELIDTLTGHKDNVTSVSFEPLPNPLLRGEGTRKQNKETKGNSYLLVSGSADGSAILWQIENKKGVQIQKLKGHQDWVTDVKLIRQENSLIIAAASRDGTIKLWNKEGELINTLSGHNGWVNSIEFTDSYLVSGGGDGKVVFWDINNNKAIETIKASEDSITDLTVSSKLTSLNPSSKEGSKLSVVFTTDYGEVRLLDIDSSGSDWQFTQQNITSTGNNIANSITFTPDKKLIAIATDTGINIYKRDGILQESLTGHNGSITDIEFKLTSPPTPPLPQPHLSPSPSPTRRGEKFQEGGVIPGEGSNVDRYTLISSGVDKTVRVWNVFPETSLEEGGIYSVATSPVDSDILATAGFDGKVKVWLQNKTNNSKKSLNTISASQSSIEVIKYSPDGNLLAIASADNTIQLWDTNKESVVKTLQGHDAAINSLAFTSNSNFLISGSEDKTVKIWDIQAINPIEILKGHTDGVEAIAISPDNKYIASAGYDQTINLWNFKGELLQSIDAHNLAITDLQFTPDGTILVSASWDNTIKLWNIETPGEIAPTPLQTLTEHQDGITDLLINKDGTLLVSASADRTIKLWNLKDGSLIKTLQGHVSKINNIAFTNNEQSIISADEQQGLFWWNLELDNLLDKGCNDIGNYLKYNSSLEKSDRDICQD